MIAKKHKNPRSAAIEILDRLWSKAIRRRDPICRKCCSAPATQAAHIFTRNNMSTRWDLENGIGMCYYCHIVWSHREPAEFVDWVKKHILGIVRFKALERKSRTTMVFSLFEYPAIRRRLSTA